MKNILKRVYVLCVIERDISSHPDNSPLGLLLEPENSSQTFRKTTYSHSGEIITRHSRNGNIKKVNFETFAEAFLRSKRSNSQPVYLLEKYKPYVYTATFPMN